MTEAADDHLIPLSDAWSLWRTICLRGTGFPIRWLESLAAPDAVAAVERLIEAEEARDAAIDVAVELSRARAAGLERDAARPWHRAIAKLKKKRMVHPIPGEPEFSRRLAAVAGAGARVDDARIAADAEIDKALAAGALAIREFAQDPRFLEALVWQNRRVIETAVQPLLRALPERTNAGIREKRELVVSYLQRYCAKNDSIGFFGPFGWAHWVADGPAASVEPGPGLIAARDIRFDHWGIAALGDMFARDPEIRAQLRPRRHPEVRLMNAKAAFSRGRRLEFPESIGRLLSACDGGTTAAEIAARLAPPEARGKIFQHLSNLAERNLVLWDAQVPVTRRAERDMADLIAAVEDAAVRAKMNGSLDALIGARETVAGASGGWKSLDAALGTFEETFSDLTGQAATRRAGATYGGRTLIYEDSRRDADVAFGPGLAGELAAPLDLVLRSAAWFSEAYDTAFERYAGNVFDELSQGHDAIPFSRLMRARRGATRAALGFVEKALDTVHRCWAEILQLDEAEKRRQFSANELHEAIYARFPEAGIVAPIARYHSPDLMIAANGADAIREGEFLIVLGEVHARMNSVMQTVVRESHPDPDILGEFARADFDRPLILDTRGRGAGGSRVSSGMSYDDAYRINWTEMPARRGRGPEIPLGELDLRKTSGGELLVETRDRAHRFHIREFLPILIPQAAATNFSLLPDMAHRPRVTIDKLVIAREQWRIPCASTEFAAAKDTRARFRGAQQWRRDNGMPRHVFFRVPFEMKPMFLDFASPVSVELFAKMVRLGTRTEQPSVVSVAEMLPASGQCWLVDAEGNRYSSELRIVAVAEKRWRIPDSLEGRSHSAAQPPKGRRPPA
jgi:hypothetical protein